ncbi:hypothetical protein [Paraburkholderia dinghuensis]|uniref:Uncharacterized protein n=1 Tax=Paraburkholderia dinghuensis TaxID=2305225 RepID=A0A3N6MRM3_9BURK|nr:hypothetical protein [Paraburkholderia dinghuensis]RQH06614.1 hypothetical protein D1Y85_12135 [Paraburkholderia dinghuensis]
MTTQTPIILGTNQHVPLASGDRLAGSSIQVSTDTGNVLVAGSDGGLFVPPVTPTIPTLTIELGHSQQAGNGYGIDQGTYYELSFSIGVTARNGFLYSVNSDGTLALGLAGTYLVVGCSKVVAPAADTYTIPGQIVLATGQQYAWPGIYQYAVQRYPDLSETSVSVAGGAVLGTVALAGSIASWTAGTSTWLGFTKINGQSGSNPLKLQGYLTYAKIA